MPRDPFRRPPMVDIPTEKRETWWTRATRRLDERGKWRAAKTLADLGELVAQFVEGKLDRTPGHWGPPNEETSEIAAPLAHANRQGFVTVNSQPGCEPDEDGWEQRAEVDGWAYPSTVEKLRNLFEGTRVEVRVVSERPWRTDFSDAVNVSRTVGPEGVWEHTHVGHTPGRLAPFIDFNRPDLVEGASYVTIVDPEWGDHSLLWDRLSQADWDHPEPPPPADNPAPPAQSVPETPMPTPATRIPSSGYVPVSTSDPERARIQQAQNHAVNLDRTAVTDQERQAAARAREEADALRDAYVGRLEAGVDAAFAERDRLDDIARASGRDEDEAAMLRQDEHAAELLDQYNAEVQADMAEIERRREQNLRIYRQHRDSGTPLPSPVEPMYQPLSAPAEDDMDGDASGNRLDPPPAAEPHVPPRRRPPRTPHPESPATTGSTGSTTGGTGMAGIEEAREGIMTMHRSAEQGLAELEQAHSSLEDAQNGLRQGTEGSNQAEADQAHAQLADAMSKIDEARQQVAQALQEFEGVAQRL